MPSPEKKPRLPGPADARILRTEFLRLYAGLLAEGKAVVFYRDDRGQPIGYVGKLRSGKLVRASFAELRDSLEDLDTERFARPGAEYLTFDGGDLSAPSRSAGFMARAWSSSSQAPPESHTHGEIEGGNQVLLGLIGNSIYRRS